MLISDTAPLVAAADRADPAYQRCRTLLESHPGPLVTTALTTNANPVAAAIRIMDYFYPTGWTGRGAGSEFSQIQKWLARNFEWS